MLKNEKSCPYCEWVRFSNLKDNDKEVLYVCSLNLPHPILGTPKIFTLVGRNTCCQFFRLRDGAERKFDFSVNYLPEEEFKKMADEKAWEKQIRKVYQ